LRRQISHEATQSNWGDLVIMEISRFLSCASLANRSDAVKRTN
jgi:hypothetical protein